MLSRDTLGVPDTVRARAFAELAHAGQRYNQEVFDGKAEIHNAVPYSFHLEAVVDVLKRFGYTSPDWVCCGYLHDVLEDTNTNYNQVREAFGIVVADRVYAVQSAKGKNRKQRNALTYPDIKGVEEYVVLKLADRIANVEFGLADKNGKSDMYRQEFPDFEKGIREEVRSKEGSRVTLMWNTLKRLLNIPVD